MRSQAGLDQVLSLRDGDARRQRLAPDDNAGFLGLSAAGGCRAERAEERQRLLRAGRQFHSRWHGEIPPVEGFAVGHVVGEVGAVVGELRQGLASVFVGAHSPKPELVRVVGFVAPANAPPEEIPVAAARSGSDKRAERRHGLPRVVRPPDGELEGGEPGCGQGQAKTVLRLLHLAGRILLRGGRIARFQNQLPGFRRCGLSSAKHGDRGRACLPVAEQRDGRDGCKEDRDHDQQRHDLSHRSAFADQKN